MAIVLAGLVGAARRWRATPPPRPRPAPSASVATIASRVEVLRGLRFRTRPVPQTRFPCTGASRGPRGPRSLLPRGAAPRRRGGAQAARADRAGRRPARRSRRRCSARASPATTTRAPSGCGSSPGRHPTRSSEMVLAHELTHALEDQRFGLARRARGRATTPRSPASRSSRARRRSSCRSTSLRYIGAEKALGGLLGSALQTGPDLPAVPPGPADLPVPRRAASSSRRCARTGGGTGSWSTWPTACACPTAPSRSCTRRSGWRSRSRCRCASTSGSHDDWRRTRRAGPGASGRRASCSAATTRPPRGLGRGPLRALAARGVRRAAVPRRRRAGDALALGHARATRASSRPRCARDVASTVPPWRPAATPSRSCSRPPRRSLVEC